MRRIGDVIPNLIRRRIRRLRESGVEPTASCGLELARFGAYELDLQTGEVWRDGIRVLTQRQPGLLLVLLVSRAGELVSRDEIRAYLWADRHVEADAGMNYCIRQIRAALNERASSATYIETLRGRGYRFIGAVALESRSESRIRPSAIPGTSGSRPSVGIQRLLTRQLVALPTAAMFLIGAAFAVWSGRGGLPLRAHYTRSAPALTLAMVPFQNLTDNEACAWLAGQIGEGVRAALGDARSARVRVVDDVDGARRDPTSIAQGQQAARPAFLLTGAITGTGRGHRFTVQVLRRATGAIVWSYSTDTQSAYERAPVIVDKLLPVLLADEQRAFE